MDIKSSFHQPPIPSESQPSSTIMAFPSLSQPIVANPGFKGLNPTPKAWKHWENDENPLEKGPSSPFSDKLMLSGF
jgi:hypothetical protein